MLPDPPRPDPGCAPLERLGAPNATERSTSEVSEVSGRVAM